jgi:hypothetical protein
MSVRMMTLVFDRFAGNGGEMMLALALADHADDEGEHVFPSVERLARKTRQSERTVQRLLRKMELDGWLVLVSNADGGRGKTRRYRISPAWIKGDKLSPFTPEKKTERVTSETLKGDIAVSPESSGEPSGSETTNVVSSPPRVPSKVPAIQFDLADGIFMNVFDVHLRRWQESFPKLDIDAELSKAEAWYMANPKRRKKNHERFILNWLARANDRLSASKPRTFQPAAAR